MVGRIAQYAPCVMSIRRTLLISWYPACSPRELGNHVAGCPTPAPLLGGRHGRNLSRRRPRLPSPLSTPPPPEEAAGRSRCSRRRRRGPCSRRGMALVTAVPPSVTAAADLARALGFDSSGSGGLPHRRHEGAAERRPWSARWWRGARGWRWRPDPPRPSQVRRGLACSFPSALSRSGLPLCAAASCGGPRLLRRATVPARGGATLVVPVLGGAD